MRSRDCLRLGFRNFIGYRKLILISMLVIVITLLLFNFMFGFTSVINATFNNTIMENKSLKLLQIDGRWNQENFTKEPFSQQDIDKISKMDNVVCVFPYMMKLVVLNNDSFSKGTYFLGLPKKALPYFADDKTKIASYNGIILNSEFEKDLKENKKVKVNYNVITSENTGAMRQEDGVIEGFYKQTEILDAPQGVSLVNIDYLMDLNAKTSGLSLEEYKKQLLSQRFLVIVRDVSKIADTAKTLEDNGYATNFYLSSSRGVPSYAKRMLNIGFVILAIIILASIILVSLTTSKILNKRQYEIAIYKTIGYSDQEVFKILITELFIFSALSFVVSIVCTFLGVELFNKISEDNVSSLMLFDIQIKPIGILLSFVIIIFIVLIAAIKNKRRVSALKPIDILRGE